ncbi:MAG TPA: serine/threonine protein kinase [Dokdonella sp.]
MELDDLKLAWKALDRRLEQQDALNLQLLRDARMDRARRGLRPLVWGQAAQMLVGGAGAFALGSYWPDHATNLPVLLSALVLHAYCIGLIVAGGVVQGHVARIDYASPVVAIQQHLLKLRRAYLLGGWIAGLPWWFLCAPLLVVLSDGAVLVRAPRLVPILLAVGCVGLAGTWLFHRWVHSPRRAALGRRLDDGAAGTSIRRASAALDELARFERE